MSTPYRLLVGRLQDKSISRVLDVTPCRLLNILREVTSKNAASLLITAVINTSLTVRQSHWRNLNLRRKIKFALYLAT
jgi:hypothetical protein